MTLDNNRSPIPTWLAAVLLGAGVVGALLAALLFASCAHAPAPLPPDAGLDYAMSVEDFRLLHIHEVAK